jgi:hypothetical protein
MKKHEFVGTATRVKNEKNAHNILVENPVRKAT